MREPSLNVLFAASEMAPLIKTGGLADVAGALTLALKELGCDVRVVLPRYGALSAATADAKVIARTELQHRTVEILETTAPQGQTLWLVACPALFDRDGNPYVDADGRDWPDNAERFALVRRAIAWLATHPPDAAFRPTSCTSTIGRRRSRRHCWRVTPPLRRRVFSHPQSRVSGHLRSTRRSNASNCPPICGRSTGLEFHGSMSFIKGGHRVRGPHHDREPDVRARNSDAGVRPWTRRTDSPSRRRVARHSERHRHDRVESRRPIRCCVRATRATNLERKLINKRAIQARWSSIRPTCRCSAS